MSNEYCQDCDMYHYVNTDGDVDSISPCERVTALVKIEALREAAKAMCHRCKDRDPLNKRENNGAVRHDSGQCYSDKIHDLIANLEER